MKKCIMMAMLLCLLQFVPCTEAQTSGANSQTRSPQAASKANPQTMEPKQILQREAPAIVTIFSLNKARERFALGTGFIVGSDGIVVTNYHVIQGAFDADIKLHDGEVHDHIRVIDYDKRRDVALLKIRATGLPVVTLGNSNVVEPGDRAYAIGNPEGLECTISDGLISARRMMEGTQMLQTSVPISHGSSGGPLYNVYGEVIGITTAGYMEGGAQNLNFAVPIRYVTVLLDSPPLNITLDELAVKENEGAPETTPTPAPGQPEPSQPASNEFSDPDGWLELTIPTGWKFENPPPEGMMFSAVKDDGSILMAYHGSSDNAEDEFNRIKKSCRDNIGQMSDYTDKVSSNERDAHRYLRMQTFQLKSDNSILIFVSAMQSNARVTGMMGKFNNNASFMELIEALKSLKY
jgi:S1-C subfamily serine protease